MSRALLGSDIRVRQAGEKGVGTMFWLKGCPRCGGDLFSDTDLFGPYITCFQCSRDLNEADVAALIPRRTLKVVNRPVSSEQMKPAA